MTSYCLPHQVPLNFEPTAAAYVVGESIVAPQAPFAEHPQTLRLVQKFGLASNFRTRRGATQPDLAQAGPTATVAGGGGFGGGGGGSGVGGGFRPPHPPGRPPLELPEPVSASLPAPPPPPFTADPAGYGYNLSLAARSAPAHAMGLLGALPVMTLDQEIDIDDD